MKTLFILNDPPYETERSYNGLRLAASLVERDDQQVRIFLIGDAAACAVAGQVTPNGCYNLERMLRSCAKHGAEVGFCGSCLDARGISAEKLVDGSKRSSMDGLTDWTVWADKIVTF